MLKSITPIFYTPLYTFHFERHEELKKDVMDFLCNDEHYKDYKENHVDLSGPNLHKEKILRNHYLFMYECLSFAMADLGYRADISVTSMWATRQKKGMYHHPHKHGNTFLAGVYYMHGSQGTQGTTFFNPDNLLQISPTRDLTREHRLRSRFTNDFIEGDFIVFPAWTIHNTSQNFIGDRYILGINSLPSGKSIDEVYDRYNYTPSEALDIDFNEEEYLRYRTGGTRT